VIAVYHVTGDKDFLVQVAVRDAEHLRDLALEAFTTRREVANLETSLIFESATKNALPIYP
jgi:DNA-binding Lrp family transcriptional regulator